MTKSLLSQYTVTKDYFGCLYFGKWMSLMLFCIEAESSQYTSHWQRIILDIYILVNGSVWFFGVCIDAEYFGNLTGKEYTSTRHLVRENL